MLFAGALSLDHVRFLDFLTCAGRLCSCYSHDRANFCSSQKGAWPAPESYSIPPPIIFRESGKWSPGLCTVVEGEVGCYWGFPSGAQLCMNGSLLCTLCHSYCSVTVQFLLHCCFWSTVLLTTPDLHPEDQINLFSLLWGAGEYLNWGISVLNHDRLKYLRAGKEDCGV